LLQRLLCFGLIFVTKITLIVQQKLLNTKAIDDGPVLYIITACQLY